MDPFDAFLNFYSADLDVQAFLGVFYSDGCVAAPKPGGNSRFQFSQGFGNRGGEAYFNVVFFPMMSMLARRFTLRLAPDVTTSMKEGVPYSSWVMMSRRSPFWSSFYSMTYVDGVKVLPLWLADTLNEVFVAYFLMGDGTWQYTSGMKLCTNSFLPSSLGALRSVLLRHGIDTVVMDEEVMKSGRMGQVLFIRKGDTASMLAMQDIARRYFCPEMMYRAGLHPDGTPFEATEKEEEE